VFLISFPVFYVIVTTPWLKCFLSGSEVTGLQILGMRLRGTPVDIVTDAQIALIHGGIRMHIGRVESAYLSERDRVRTAADLVHLVKWGLNEADPKPAWAIDAAGLTLKNPPRLPS
jgi:uncharacterized protein YqfA (UPF0365 family)